VVKLVRITVFLTFPVQTILDFVLAVWMVLQLFSEENYEFFSKSQHFFVAIKGIFAHIALIANSISIHQFASFEQRSVFIEFADGQ